MTGEQWGVFREFFGENWPRYSGTTLYNKQRVLTPGHQGWNDLHSLCRIGMEYYLLNNDNRNNNNNDNDYNHNNDTNNDNNENENENDKNSSDSMPVTVKG